MNGTNENKGARALSQTILDAIEERRKNPRLFIRDTVVFVIGFLFSRCHVVFGARPLAISLLCALPYRIWVALIGCIFGFLTLGKSGFIYTMIACVTVFLRFAVSGGARGESEFGKFKSGGLLRLSIAAIGGFTIAACELLISGVNSTSILFSLAMVILSPLLSSLFSYLFTLRLSLENVLFESTQAFSLNGKRGEELLYAVLFRVSAAAYAFFITLSLGTFEFLGISLSYIFCALATLLVARRFGALHGAGVGFAAALAISPIACTAFAISGLAAGALFRVGIPYALVGSGLALTAWSSYSLGITGLLSTLPEYVIGAALAYPIVGKLALPREEARQEERELPSRDMVGTMALAYRNKYAGTASKIPEALSELTDVVCRFADSAEKKDLELYRDVLKAGCEDFLEKYGSIPDAHLFVGSVIESSEQIASRLACGERLSLSVLEDIYHTDVPTDKAPLCDSVNLRIAALEEAFVKRKSAMRAEDFAALASIISDAQAKDDAEKAADSAHDEQLSKILESCGFSSGTIRAFGDRYKHVIAAGEDADGLKITSPELKRGIEEVLGVKLAPAEYYRRGNLVLMEATATRKLTAFFATAGKDGYENEISGDTALCFEASDDKFYSLICDGMGSGRIAKSTSLFASNFLKSLLGRGCNADGTLHVLNSLIKASADECSATVDLFELDLMNSEARFLKCGAASSYVKRDSSVFRIRSRTAPIGLLKSIDAERIRVEVRCEDFIIMLSDGVCQGADEAPWLIELLSKYNGHKPEELADKILDAAKKFSSLKDDMSVCVIKVVAS